MQIIKQTPENIRAAFASFAPGQDLQQWALGRVAKLPAILEKRPLFYRGFGPYWWLVKQAIIDGKNFEFGEFVDAEAVEALDYGDTGLNLAMATFYFDQQEATGALQVQEHYLDGADGEPVEYILEDVDMEWRERGRQAEGAQ